MKTLRISDDAHQKLTALLGELTAQTMKMQTYTDAIESLLAQSVILPPELLERVENLILQSKQYGYATREEFIKDAIRVRLSMLTGEYEYIEMPREKYELLNKAVKEMMLPGVNAADYIDNHIDTVVEEYQRWLRETEGERQDEQEE